MTFFMHVHASLLHSLMRGTKDINSTERVSCIYPIYLVPVYIKARNSTPESLVLIQPFLLMWAVSLDFIAQIVVKGEQS